MVVSQKHGNEPAGCAKCQVLTAVFLSTKFCWSMTLCRWVSCFRRFEGIQCLHIKRSSSLLCTSVNIWVPKQTVRLLAF
jgi:hypothetical protein